MSRRSQDGDELMVDVIKISFEEKLVTNCTWVAPPQALRATTAKIDLRRRVGKGRAEG